MTQITATSGSLQQVPDFEDILQSVDVQFLDSVAGLWSSFWGAARVITLFACYRMKQLFEMINTRKEAVTKTGYSSWTDWLTSHDWPVSVAEIRTRVLDMTILFRAGATPQVVAGILANAPTAGQDVREKMLDADGHLLPEVDESLLPGGSLEGLLEAIASQPNPGQARALVRQAVGQPGLMVTDALYTEGVLYIRVLLERPDGASVWNNLRIANFDDQGNRIDVPKEVAYWLLKLTGHNYGDYLDANADPKPMPGWFRVQSGQ